MKDGDKDKQFAQGPYMASNEWANFVCK